MFDPITTELLKYGLAGIFIAYLIVVGYRQNNRNDTRYDALLTQFQVVQEKRAEEREKNALVMASAAEAQRQQAEAVEKMATVLASFSEKVATALSLLGNQQQRGR